VKIIIDIDKFYLKGKEHQFLFMMKKNYPHEQKHLSS
jgi:hypothetical protein